ncbi:Odorant receptor 29 [Cephus cinctus]|uniref:Odorant receptor n=1 Tax=Cephus cinctus TaxID=211228 RepID=A0A3L9M0X8_CEPCN|nr:odorant receptor 13a isoform X2 [Cephus cinctus]RLZ02233.1 Odorant receptor 29 [Cephus cinctus]
MGLDRDHYFSIRVTRFFLRLTGFWIVESKRDEMVIDFALIYTRVAVLLAAVILSLDLYHLSEDLYDMVFTICNLMTVLTVVFKLLIMTWHRNSVANLISFSLNEFWHKDYKSTEMDILKNCERQCIVLILAFIMSACGTGCSYMMRPIIENIGKNETDRIHPIKVWLDLPLATTPYFEIMYFVEILITTQVAICFFCFDIFLCVLNIHVSGQLEILQSRLECIYDENRIESPKMYSDEKLKNLEKSSIAYNKLCNCIKYHEMVIWYVQQIERIFTIIILGQMLTSSLLTCLVGFQLLSGIVEITKRYIFIAYMCGCIVQLITYTFTCNEITVASLQLADVAFHADWYVTPYDKGGRSIRHGIKFLVQRTQRPLCLTAGGFFPVSLDSFTKVISTAMSYFTILREREIHAA